MATPSGGTAPGSGLPFSGCRSSCSRTGGQWSAILSAALLLPWLGPVAAAKPNLGAAILAGTRSKRSALILVAGSVAVLAA